MPKMLTSLCMRPALPCRPNGAGQQLDLQFQGQEASEALNFVIKDNSTGRWYDFNGDNFHVPLSLDYEQQAEAARSSPKESKAAVAEPPLRDDQLPQLPDELCGVWAYITWEAAGCPNRSQDESSREYQNAIKVSLGPAVASSCQSCHISPSNTSFVLQMGHVERFIHHRE